MKSKGTSSSASSASTSRTGRARNGKNGVGNGHGAATRARVAQSAPAPGRDAALMLQGQPPIQAHLAAGTGGGDGEEVAGGRCARRNGGRNGNGNGHHDDDDELDKMTLLKALMAFKKGAFWARLPVDLE